MSENTNANTGVTLLVAAQDAVNKLGTTGKTALPKVNDIKAGAMLEYALAKAINDAATARFKAARQHLINTLADAVPTTAGPRSIIFESSHGLINAGCNRGAMRLDKTQLVTVLMRECSITEKEAQALIAKASKESEPALHIEVILR